MQRLSSGRGRTPPLRRTWSAVGRADRHRPLRIHYLRFGAEILRIATASDIGHWLRNDRRQGGRWLLAAG
nr:MAG TPA: hypothetical protein [Caudoviricetes sp.]